MVTLVAACWRTFPHHPSVLTCLLQTLCTAFTLPLALALAMLLVWNLWLAARNLTTIEFHEVSH